MAFNRQLARSLRAVRDSLEKDGVSRTNSERALQAACDVERDYLVELAISKITADSARFSRSIAEHVGIPGIDSWAMTQTGTFETPESRDPGKAVRSARKWAEQNGKID